MFGLETCREEQDGSCSLVLQDQGAQICRQVWIAAGPCNWEMCYEDTSYTQMRDLTVYSQGEGQLVFYQDLWSGVRAEFSVKSKEETWDTLGE